MLLQPYEYANQANWSDLKKDIYPLNRIQWAAKIWVKDLNYEERPKALKLQSLAKER